MAGRAPSPSELTGRHPVWCLDLDWGGRRFRLAEEPVDLTLPDGSVVAYVDALSRPDVRDEIIREGIQESASVPLAVFLDGVDIAAEVARNRRLESVRGELFMVLVNNAGVSGQTFAQRFRYLTGRLSQPQYADPQLPSSWLSFTLEDNAGDDSSLLLDDAAVITSTTWSTAPGTVAGKIYPVVIGAPGLYRKSSGALAKTSGSPAYVVAPASGDATKLLIAGHQVEAATVLIFDESGLSQSFAVTHEADGLGRVVAVVDISTPGSIEPADREFWTCWDNGGALRSPFSTVAMSGLGDVCAWALARTSLRVDIQRWIAEGGILNRIDIATYINEPGLSPWSFVTRLLESMLVEVRSGPDGLFPQGRLLDVNAAEAMITLTEGAELEAVSPVTVRAQISEVINRTAIRFAPRAKTGDYKRTVIVQADPDPDDPEAFSDEYAVISVNRWSTDPATPVIQAESITLDFIYDDVSAALVARERVRVQGFGYSDCVFIGDVALGYLSPGEHIRLDSDRLARTGMVAEVISKRWTGEAWEFTLAIDVDPLRDSTTHKIG